MKLDTCIKEGDGTKLIVTEVVADDTYLPEDSSLTAKNRFAYSETCSLDFFVLNSISGDAYSEYVIARRDEGGDVEISLSRDGWFTAYHAVVPTDTWVYNELSRNGSVIRTYDAVYFSDGHDLYKYEDKVTWRVTPEELFKEERDNTTISKCISNYFSVRNLEREINDKYKDIFLTRLYNNGKGIKACDANRLIAGDTLIRHYVRHGQLAEAERIIEKINYATPNSVNTNNTGITNNKGCGCV